MKFYFQLKTPHNKLFADIAETIINTYPIGVQRESKEYNSYPGIKKIDAIVEQSMTNNKKFNKPWRDFLIKIRKSINSRIHNIGMASEFSFTGELILERYKDDSLVREKKIIFVVSLLGPYFTIYGVDETAIKDKIEQHDIAYKAINVITVSPFKEFEKHFILLKLAIEQEFADYKFVPFKVTTLYIEGVQPPYSNLTECTIYGALFNNSFDYRHIPSPFRGDINYGSEQSNITVRLQPPPA